MLESPEARRFFFAYREASEKFRQGQDACFPSGAFLPSPGFNATPG